MLKIPLTEKDIKRYLDKCILYWRKKRDNRSNYEEERLKAIHYIDAFQSVRTSLFDELLK